MLFHKNHFACPMCPPRDGDNYTKRDMVKKVKRAARKSEKRQWKREVW